MRNFRSFVAAGAALLGLAGIFSAAPALAFTCPARSVCVFSGNMYNGNEETFGTKTFAYSWIVPGFTSGFHSLIETGGSIVWGASNATGSWVYKCYDGYTSNDYDHLYLVNPHYMYIDYGVNECAGRPHPPGL